MQKPEIQTGSPAMKSQKTRILLVACVLLISFFLCVNATNPLAKEKNVARKTEKQLVTPKKVAKITTAQKIPETNAPTKGKQPETSTKQCTTEQREDLLCSRTGLRNYEICVDKQGRPIGPPKPLKCVEFE